MSKTSAQRRAGNPLLVSPVHALPLARQLSQLRLPGSSPRSPHIALVRSRPPGTTLAPCWYCSGLVRQFGIGMVVVGKSVNFDGGVDWLRENGVEVVDLADPRCIKMLGDWIATNPEVWNEDIREL